MPEPEVISHWSKLVDGLQVSPKDFYTQVESAIGKRNVPGASISRVALAEGGLFSSSREYLRVTRKDCYYDICAAPFGNGFFVSSWLLREISGIFAILAALPIFGAFFFRFIKPLTYYQVDTADMFQSAVHTAVMEVLDAQVKAKGLREISEAERKPVLREFFR